MASGKSSFRPLGSTSVAVAAHHRNLDENGVIRPVLLKPHPDSVIRASGYTYTANQDPCEACIVSIATGKFKKRITWTSPQHVLVEAVCEHVKADTDKCGRCLGTPNSKCVALEGDLKKLLKLNYVKLNQAALATKQKAKEARLLDNSPLPQVSESLQYTQEPVQNVADSFASGTATVVGDPLTVLAASMQSLAHSMQIIARATQENANTNLQIANSVAASTRIADAVTLLAHDYRLVHSQNDYDKEEEGIVEEETIVEDNKSPVDWWKPDASKQ